MRNTKGFCRITKISKKRESALDDYVKYRLDTAKERLVAASSLIDAGCYKDSIKTALIMRFSPQQGLCWLMKELIFPSIRALLGIFAVITSKQAYWTSSIPIISERLSNTGRIAIMRISSLSTEPMPSFNISMRFNFTKLLKII